MRLGRLWIWGPIVVIYAAVWLWYTPLSGPLTTEEIEAILADAERLGPDRQSVERLRRFFEEDDGRSFVMVNVLDLADRPETLPATGPNASAMDLLDHYMEYMYPALLRRASHPVFAGRALSDSLDLVGIDGAERWETAALMRYRSRRDLWEIAAHPSFNERHAYKLEALEKTIAFPVAPQLFISDLRVVLALALLALAGILDALFVRRG